MKIGFIGLGNMATAMIGGMLQKGIAAPEDIIGSALIWSITSGKKMGFTARNRMSACAATILLSVVVLMSKLMWA